MNDHKTRVPGACPQLREIGNGRRKPAKPASMSPLCSSDILSNVTSDLFCPRLYYPRTKYQPVMTSIFGAEIYHCCAVFKHGDRRFVVGPGVNHFIVTLVFMKTLKPRNEFTRYQIPPRNVMPYNLIKFLLDLNEFELVRRRFL